MRGIIRRCGLLLLIAAGLLAGCADGKSTEETENAEEASSLALSRSSAAYQDFGELELITASDLHYLSPRLTDHGAYFTELIRESDGKTMAYSSELLDAFVDTVIQKKPAALILTGDLTFNGARESHEDLAKKLEEIKGADIPVLVLSGNHDLQNNNAASFHGDSFTRVSSITAEEFEEIYSDFGFSGALSKDEASSSYVFELTPGVRLLLLDVNGVENTCRVPDSTLLWIEEQLQDAESQKSLVLSFSHQNLLQHSMFVSGYVIDNADAVLDLYKKYGVRVNFTGHLHIQHIGDEDGIFEIATSALSISPEHYGITLVTPESVTYDTASVDVSGWAKKSGSDNEDLLDFGTYSREFFLDTCRRQAMAELSDIEDEETKERMAEYFAKRNYAYFSGEPFGEEDEEDKKTLSLWEERKSFTASYLTSLGESTRPDQNHVTIHLER